ncbi:MAG: WecB/TagA/CpsF family glycosyltransferase [Bacteroidales bacterium]|jgi:N-acetylglucosaminyldiphosphoundecaprenol N-acetyl-beta-D-mannosaminyltransferase|nr:WecB/TagA/CpsF family glycosyltransferase [Bacteroidales bacterium]
MAGLFGYDIFEGELKDLDIDSKKVINTINAYSYVLAKKDREFRNSLQKSDILLPDGFPIVAAISLLSNIKISKIAGEDVFFHLLNQLNQKAGKVFFLGSSGETLAKIYSRLSAESPNVKAYFFSPPFKVEFTANENREMIEAVNKIKPDVLFVGMTAPKQEKWVYANKTELNTKIICSIGAVFDFYAETVKRPSKFWINLRLEWFIRLINEPERLWKRYLLYSPQFFIDVINSKIKK